MGMWATIWDASGDIVARPVLKYEGGPPGEILQFRTFILLFPSFLNERNE